MENSKYKAIVFDFFGVLSSEVAFAWLSKHFSGEKMAELRKVYIVPIDKGDLPEKEWFDALGKLLSVSSKQVRDEWLGLATIDQDMIALVRRLKGSYKLAILSDAPSPFFREVIAKDKLENLFDEIIVSSEVHMTKESPGSYRFVLDKLSISPEDAIFIDDNPANVDRALSLGMKGIIFSGRAKLESDLSDLGVTP